MQYMSLVQTKAIIGLVLTSLFWSGNIFVSKFLIGVVPPSLLNLIRWGLAILVLLPFVYPQLRGSFYLVKDSWQSLSFFGFLGVTSYNALLYTAAYTTSGLNIAVISTVTPILTVVLAWRFLGEKPGYIELFGFLFGLLGVLILLSKGSLQNLLHLVFSYGDFWMLIACVFWALYTVFLKKMPPKLNPLLFMFFSTAFGFLLAVPFVVWELINTEVQIHINLEVSLALLYVGVFPSIFGYLFFNFGVRVLGSQMASLNSYLIPVFAAIIGILFLNEKVEIFHFVSQVAVFFGFCLVIFGSKKGN